MRVGTVGESTHVHNTQSLHSTWTRSWSHTHTPRSKTSNPSASFYSCHFGSFRLRPSPSPESSASSWDWRSDGSSSGSERRLASRSCLSAPPSSFSSSLVSGYNFSRGGAVPRVLSIHTYIIHGSIEVLHTCLVRTSLLLVYSPTFFAAFLSAVPHNQDLCFNDSYTSVQAWIAARSNVGISECCTQF